MGGSQNLSLLKCLKLPIFLPLIALHAFVLHGVSQPRSDRRLEDEVVNLACLEYLFMRKAMFCIYFWSLSDWQFLI